MNFASTTESMGSKRKKFKQGDDWSNSEDDGASKRKKENRKKRKQQKQFEQQQNQNSVAVFPFPKTDQKTSKRNVYKKQKPENPISNSYKEDADKIIRSIFGEEASGDKTKEKEALRSKIEAELLGWDKKTEENILAQAKKSFNSLKVDVPRLEGEINDLKDDFDKNAPQNVRALIEMAQKVYDEEMVESLRRMYLKGRERVLEAAIEQREVLREKQEAQKNEKNNDGQENIKLIETRIETSKKRWQREQDIKINNLKVKDLQGLKDSNEFYIDKITNLELEFEKNITGRLSHLVKLIYKAEENKKIKEAEPLVADLKKAYIRNFEQIRDFIDGEIEKRSGDSDSSIDSEHVGSPEDGRKKEYKNAKVDKEIEKWERSNLRSKEGLLKKDEAALIKYIDDKKGEIAGYKKNWAINFPKTAKDLIAELRLDDIVHANQVKRIFINGKEDLLFEAERLLAALNKKEAGADMKNGEDTEQKDEKFEDLEGKAAEAQAEIENLSEKEKKTLFEGVADFGYWTSKVRSKGMGKIMNWMAKASSKNDNLHNYFMEYENIYKEDQKRAESAIETNEKNIKAKTMGTVQGAGNLMKYGRVLYDIWDSGSARGLNPFRHVTAGAMLLGRSAEAAKRTIINGEAIKEKTRIEDVSEAMKEAEEIFRINLKEDGTTGLNMEDLEKTYRNQLPEDIMLRIDRGGGIKGAGWIQFLFKQDAKGKVNRILKKLHKVDKNKKNQEEKEAEKEKIMQKYSVLLQDLDAMITHEGMADNLAYTSRVVEELGKTAANVFIVDSVARLAQGAYNMNLFDQAWDKGEEYTEKLQSAIKSSKDIISSILGEDAVSKTREMSDKYQGMIQGQFGSERAEVVDSSSLEDAKRPVEVVSVPKNNLRDVVEPQPIISEEEIKEAGRATQEKVVAEEIGPSLTRAINNNLSDPTAESSISNTRSVNSMDKPLKLNGAGVPVIDAPHEEPVARVASVTPVEQGEMSQIPEIDTKFEKQIELATIQAGPGSNSIEGVFIKQLVNNPSNFGFEGDVDDVSEVKRWAGGQAHRIAIDNGYFDSKTGQGIRMKASSIDHNAYMLKGVKGGIGVDEYVSGELREAHLPGGDFENGDIEENEYIHSKKTLSTETPERANTIIENKTVSSGGQGPVATRIEDTIEPGEKSLQWNNPDELARDGARVENGLVVPENTESVDRVEARPDDKPAPIIEAEVEKTPSAQQQEILDYYQSFGISQDNLSEAGIDITDGFSDEENLKSTYLIDRQGNVEKGIEVIRVADKLGASYEEVGEYYEQLKKLDGRNAMSRGLIELLKPGGEKRLGLSKIFDSDIEEGGLEIEGNTYTIKNFKEGINIVVEKDGGDIKFGVTGNVKWGMNSALFGKGSPDMSLTKKNIDEALEKIADSK